MKKTFFIALAVMLVVNFIFCKTMTRVSGNTSAWAGTYTGLIPSAGGEGINVRITLDPDETYTVEYQYIGKSDDVFTSTGTFNWNPQGDTIIMDNEGVGDAPAYYKFGENILIHLDMEGNVITGEFADNYILRKQL